MEISGCGMFSLMLRVPKPESLIDADKADQKHDFNVDGAKSSQITTKIVAYTEWLAKQPDEAFVGPRGNNNKEHHLKIVLWVVGGDYQDDGNEVWGFLNIPPVLMAECVRRDLPIRVVVNSLF
jgi:hypothetical protein